MSSPDTGAWSLSGMGPSDRLLAALYLRDALRLRVEVDEGVPPALTPAVPDLGQRVSLADRQEATARWPLWWKALVRDSLGLDPGPLLARLASMTAPQRSWSSRMDFGLPPHSALAHCMQMLRQEAEQWSADLEDPDDDDPAGMGPEHEIVRETAEAVARDAGVRLDSVTSRYVSLPVVGVWWHLVAPGAAICSDGAVHDDAAPRVWLRELYLSAVSR